MTHQFDSQTFVKRMEAAGMARAIAEELADALGSVVLDGLATKRDVEDGVLKLDGHLREVHLRLSKEARELELRLMLRMGALFAATLAILGVLITFK